MWKLLRLVEAFWQALVEALVSDLMTALVDCLGEVLARNSRARSTGTGGDIATLLLL